MTDLMANPGVNVAAQVEACYQTIEQQEAEQSFYLMLAGAGLSGQTPTIPEAPRRLDSATHRDTPFVAAPPTEVTVAEDVEVPYLRESIKSTPEKIAAADAILRERKQSRS